MRLSSYLNGDMLTRWHPQPIAKWEKQRVGGQFHFILFYGVKWGLVIFLFWTAADCILEIIRYGHLIELFDYRMLSLKAIFLMLFGIIGGVSEWNSRELSFQKYKRRQATMAELLLIKKADVNAKNNTGLAPLHMAAIWCHKDAAELLLAKGADVDVRDVVGFTPLHWATISDNTEMAELLLVNNADINAKDKDSKTSLHYAALADHKELVKLLRQYGGHE